MTTADNEVTQNEEVTNEEVVNEEVDTGTPEPTEPVKEEVTPVDYSWVPAKFMKGDEPDFAAMAKSYISLEKKLGSKGALAPDSVDAYDYTPKYELPTEWKEKALTEAKLSPEQFKWVASQYESLLDAASPSPEKAEAALKERWGDQFEVKARNAVKAYEVYVPSHISMEEIGNNPLILDILAQVGSELGEDTARQQRPAGPAQGLTKADIAKIMGSEEYYRDPKLRAQVEEWYAKNGTSSR